MSKGCSSHAPSTQTEMTEVHEAAAAGDSALIETLLDTGKYDVNGPDPEWNNRTPLHWAAIKGHSESIRMLVEYGAKLDVITDSGWTPAHFAAEGGKILALRAMHKLEAPFDITDNFGDTPKRIAEIYGQRECLEFLEQCEIELKEKRAREAAIQLLAVKNKMGVKKKKGFGIGFGF